MNTKQLLGRTKRARRNLALKLVLERRFKPELTAYFNKLIKSFTSFYIATGGIVRPESFSDDTRSLLKKHYLRVSKAFSDEMRLSITGKSLFYTKNNEELSAKIDAGILVFINQSLSERSNNLDNTTIEYMLQSIQESEKEITEEGGELTNLAVALLATRILKRKFESRKKTLNTTETQYMAESTKAVESTILASDGEVDINNIVGAVGLGIAFGSKQWASVLDDRTRTGIFNHVLADGQKVRISEPFIVSGEMIPYPGNSSLGASLGNVINCRCSALYSL